MIVQRCRWVLTLILCVGFSCQHVHPLALPASPLAVPLEAANPNAYPGLPSAWHRWVGLDPVAVVRTIDWVAHLEGEFAGGVKMHLNCETEASRAVQHTLVDGRQVPGVTCPASVSVNGDLVLELEVFAIESVDPVRLVGGLIGVRAQRPGNESETVTLSLIGAGVRRDEAGISRAATATNGE